MIFEQPQCVPENQDRSPGRRAIFVILAQVFRLTFPMLGFRIFDKITAINAQASVRNGLRSVDFFGGLAFHPAVDRDALVFIYLHEAGHHLSHECRHPCNAQIACDCAADCPSHWRSWKQRPIWSNGDALSMFPSVAHFHIGPRGSKICFG
jgi:hypothetical protein